MPETVDAPVDAEPKDKRTRDWKEWKARQSAPADAPPAETTSVVLPMTIEERAGLPLGENPTQITPDMGQDEIDALVGQAQRHAGGKPEPRAKVTTFYNKTVPVVVSQSKPVLVPPIIDKNVPVALNVKGDVLDFVEFCNRRFAHLDKPSTDAVMTSDNPIAAFAVVRKLYVAYIYAVRHATEAEAQAQAGKMD